VCERETERDRERKREKDRERDRERDRETDRQRERDTEETIDRERTGEGGGKEREEDNQKKKISKMAPLMFSPYELYGVATISRLLKITGLFCKRAL